MLQPEELQKLAHKVASKYRSSQNYEDLVQEGILAVLESEATTPEEACGILRTTMFNHQAIFFGSSLTVPKTGAVKQVIAKMKRGEELETATENAIASALTANQGPVQEQVLGGTADTESEYIESEHQVILRVLMDSCLGAREKFIVNAVVTKDQSFKDVSKVLEISPEYARRLYHKAVEEMKLEFERGFTYE